MPTGFFIETVHVMNTRSKAGRKKARLEKAAALKAAATPVHMEGPLPEVQAGPHGAKPAGNDSDADSDSQ